MYKKQLYRIFESLQGLKPNSQLRDFLQKIKKKLGDDKIPSETIGKYFQKYTKEVEKK